MEISDAVEPMMTMLFGSNILERLRVGITASVFCLCRTASSRWQAVVSVSVTFMQLEAGGSLD